MSLASHSLSSLALRVTEAKTMATRKKNKRKREERPTIHPKNKYSNNPPDFALLASLYPSFNPFVFYSRNSSRPQIDWTDFNATRELTRVLLLHDHGLNWWIPDGQLCPTVPNRSNYIHWVNDLLSSDIVPRSSVVDGRGLVKGFDIGTGANCIYPLLGASLLGWSFVGSDVTDVAIEWAERNVKSNEHIAELIEVRKVQTCQGDGGEESSVPSSQGNVAEESKNLQSAGNEYLGPPVLVGVVRDDERFDFCMCNPPFFESMEEAGLNPKTACGGTPEEMVCPGGEKAFITRIIEDSVILKEAFRWYTSMIGRKANLKFLTSKLWEVGATVVKTTEFVQGETCRWGLAWSFVPPVRKIISTNMAEKSNISFTLEGIQRQFSAIHVLQSIESFFCSTGSSCKLNTSTFTVDITASNDSCNTILKNEANDGSSCLPPPLNNLCFRLSVFQQIPGTLLVKASLQKKDIPVAGIFSSIIKELEETLREKFCRAKAALS